LTQISLEPLGLLEVADSDVYEFPGGLPGFTHVRRFALVRPPEFAPLGWLAALDEPGLAFVVVDPLVFFDRYQPRLAPEDLEVLGLRDQGRATILTILNIPDDPSLTTANLRGPVALNPESRTGRQAILAGQDYLTRHPITEGQGGRDPVARTHPQAQSEHHHR
jgi:flagellar assembly factor FliW